MPDMSSIGVVASSLNTAVNIAKAMLDIRDATLIQGKVFELQRAILEAQQSVFAANDERSTLIERIRTLEAEIARLETWAREKERYQLTEVCSGVVAYTLKPEAQGAEALHWLCPTCYQRGKKAILQAQEMAGSNRVWKCFECGTELRVWRSVTPSKAAVIAEIASMPQVPQAARVPGEACPKCGEFEYRVERSVPHPTFGQMGKTQHEMKCDSCGFTDRRTPR